MSPPSPITIVSPRVSSQSRTSRHMRCGSIGTSSLVYPAAGLAESALRAGATVIEVNPDRTDLSRAADIVLGGPSGMLLPRLLTALG